MIRSDHERVGDAGREAILEAFFTAAGKLRDADVRVAIEQALGVVARAVQADTARVFRFAAAADGPPGARCYVEWSGEGAGSASHGDPPGAPAAHASDSWWHAVGAPASSRGSHVDERSGREGNACVDQGIAAMLVCPIVVDGVPWGKVQLERRTSVATWSEEGIRLLEPFAEHLAELLEAKRTEMFGWHRRGRTSRDGSNGPSPRVEEPAVQLHRRVRAERALVEASKLLLSTEPFDMEELLRIVGEATRADYAYLITIRPEEEHGPAPLAPSGGARRPPIDLDAYAHYEWHAPGTAKPPHSTTIEFDGEAPRPDGSTFAVPILSSQHLLFGYLGIDFEDEATPLQDEDVRVLNVLGDMLCTYLQRRIAHRALRESERRYRYFVGTISEAIWRVDFDPSVAIDAPSDRQVEAILRSGTVAECNDEFARLFGLERSEQLVGWSTERLAEYTGRRIVQDFVDAGFRLQSREYTVQNGTRDSRHFIVNTSGVVEDGRLISVWGSTTEVTERVQLERRMVTALEQQQQRIGRDLHDSVGQLLTGVRMLAQNLEERHFGPDKAGNQQVRKIISYADEAARHVSDLQRGLMPVQMERGGLAQALQELASSTDVLPEVDCIYVLDQATDVRDREKKLQLYRIAQEATNNALKHAHPSYVKIALTTSEDTIVLEVEDDGMGFDVKQATEESLGLHSMYYRARSINANLRVHSEPGHGTTVRCEVARRELMRRR